MNRPELVRRQLALDDLARHLDWTRGSFGSWKVKGYTVALAARGWPRLYVAARRGEVREFRELGDLNDFILKLARSRT